MTSSNTQKSCGATARMQLMTKTMLTCLPSARNLTASTALWRITAPSSVPARQPDPPDGGMDCGSWQTSWHYFRQRLGAGAVHAGREQIQELPQTAQQCGAAVWPFTVRRMRRLHAPEADQPPHRGRRADLHLHVLHQGAQPRHRLRHGKLQRQHTGCQNHRGSPQAVR